MKKIFFFKNISRAGIYNLCKDYVCFVDAHTGKTSVVPDFTKKYNGCKFHFIVDFPQTHKFSKFAASTMPRFNFL